ncbi:hypothetical protein ACI2OX_08940 [Bacillus sp. N9]
MGGKLFSIIAISFIFIAAIIYVPFALAANADKVVITGDVVNVREFPGTSNTVITQVREGKRTRSKIMKMAGTKSRFPQVKQVGLQIGWQIKKREQLEVRHRRQRER